MRARAMPLAVAGFMPPVRAVRTVLGLQRHARGQVRLRRTGGRGAGPRRAAARRRVLSAQPARAGRQPGPGLAARPGAAAALLPSMTLPIGMAGLVRLHGGQHRGPLSVGLVGAGVLALAGLAAVAAAPAGERPAGRTARHGYSPRPSITTATGDRR